MTDPLRYPFDQAPEPGQRREVAPGVHWLNFPLPFALDHINLWLLEDGDGWTLVDTGFSSRHTVSSSPTTIRTILVRPAGWRGSSRPRCG